jgi:predicted small secreted protein
MAVNVSGAGVPIGTDVEVDIKIHTHLNISAYVAKQKANVSLALHCGQSFFVDDPILQVGQRTCWLVPVWLSTPRDGRHTKIGEFAVDAQTGEILDVGERCRVLKQIANALLQAATPAA